MLLLLLSVNIRVLSAMYDNRALVWIFRLGVFVGLLSAVVTVIYLTPVPGRTTLEGTCSRYYYQVEFTLYPQSDPGHVTGSVTHWSRNTLFELQHASCQRPCHELDWPMICRVKIVLETSTYLTRGCPVNGSDCPADGCIHGTKVRHKILTANGKLPGPTIQVCENDILVVDVVNRVSGAGIAVHWRGQMQRDTPYMDGTASVSQCPISSFATFQYKFRATNPGTHLWQVYTGNTELDALAGALIVRQAPRKEPHHDLYDEDDYFVLINEVPSTNDHPASAVLLINGLPFSQSSQELSQFNMTMAKRHRLRIVYAVTALGCPISVDVDQHSLLVIAIDGHPVRPVEVQSLRLAPGERVDAVLVADQEIGDYLLKARTGSNCPSTSMAAMVLSYQPDHTAQSSLIRPPQHHSSLLKSLSTVGGGECSRPGDSELVCLPKIESLSKLSPELSAERLEFTLYLTLDSTRLPPRSMFEEVISVPRINNLTLALPSSPLLSQPDAVEPGTLCSGASLPAHCDNAPVCECLHVIDIPLNTPVELVLIDQGNEREHVFHLHGYSFHVVGAVPHLGQEGLQAVKEADSRHQLMSRNLRNPVIKDTVALPAGGVAAVRFKADNPGYWLLNDERWPQLGVIFHVGSSEDIPPVPENFPTCGSWVGPEFFLI